MYHVRDGVIGLAIGDAMGVPTEGNKREILLAKPVVKMLPKISAGIPKGAWSDNTSLSIATITLFQSLNPLLSIAFANAFPAPHEQLSA